MSDAPRYGWRRFWRPQGLDVSCGAGDGFLDDPEREGVWSYNPKCRTLPDLLARNPILVLCGPPGSGKSTELRLVEEVGLNAIEEFEVISRNAAAFGASSPLLHLSVRSPQWENARRNGKGILFLIDGLDEALQREQTLLSSLIELLKTESSLEKVRLVLACRSAQWLSETGQALARLWNREGSEFVYELCPLRRADAALALREEIPDRLDSFFEELARCEAAPLARWPITLNMLIAQFRDTGSLPSSRRVLYHSAIKRLIEEWNPVRERNLRSTDPNWIPGEKLQLARRIAAMTIFGGKKALVRSNHSSDPDLLTYADVLGNDGILEIPSGGFVALGLDKIDRITETRLLESGASGNTDAGQAVRFSHRTLAELLAGEFVAGLPTEELRRLFFVTQPNGEECVAPQLLQTAAWLTGHQEGGAFSNLLLSLHPEALLHADLSPLSSEQKAAVVASLIAKADAGDPGPDRAISRASHSLGYPGIEDLLRPAILDESRHLHARRFAFSLARICHVAELADAIWQVLDRPQDTMRRDAGYALRVISKDPSLWIKHLRNLAAGEMGPDPDDTLKGMAMRLLVPRLLPVRDIINWLSPPKMTFFHGAYQGFLHFDLPKAVVLEDLEDCLDFLRTKLGCFDSLSPYKSFSNRIFDLACENLHFPKIADSLLRLWLETVRRYLPLPRQSDPTEPLAIFSDTDTCEIFVQTFLNHTGVSNDDVRNFFSLTSTLGLGFLLDQIAKAPKSKRSNWALAIRYAAGHEEREGHRELLQQRFEEFEEIRKVFPPIQKNGLDIHDTLTRFEKAGDLILKRRQKRNQEKFRRIPKPHLTGKDVFLAGLEQCRSGKAGGWINISHGIIRESKPADPVVIKIGNTELFLDQSEGDQQLIQDCARKFLFEFADERSDRNHRTNWSESAYWAISWLRDEVDADPDLRKEVSQKWIGAIIDAFDNGEDEHQELVTRAYRWNSDATRQWLRTKLDRYLVVGDPGWLLPLMAFETVWNRTLSEDLKAFLAAPEIRPVSIRDGLLHLLKHDSEFGRELISEYLESIKSSDPGLAKPISRVVAAVTTFFGDSKSRESAWPLIAGNRTTAKSLFLENVPEIDRRELKTIELIDSYQIADLLILLFQLFPPEQDLPLNESTVVTPTDECIGLRRDLLQLLIRRGETAEIQRFLNSLPTIEADLYRWNLDEAKQNRALIDWEPSQPAEILRLVRIAEGSLIRNADDLLEVVLASLARFQNDLQYHHVHRVWDGQSPKHEEFVSKEIEDWLKHDLKRVAVNREVEVNRFDERVDLKIEAFPSGNSDGLPITLIIEVKRAQNPEIPDSIKNQLVGKYLAPNPGWNHGIYLVAWFYTQRIWEERQYLKSKTPKSAAKELAMHCSEAGKTSDCRIAPFLLDCSCSPRAEKKRERKRLPSRG